MVYMVQSLIESDVRALMSFTGNKVSPAHTPSTICDAHGAPARSQPIAGDCFDLLIPVFNGGGWGGKAGAVSLPMRESE